MQRDSSLVTDVLPSPNHDSRNGQPVSLLVLHYTGMQSGAEAIERLRAASSRVSAHYVVEEDGRIFQLVAESQRAWHAGVSYWRGIEGVNASSIGIEIVNPGHEFGYRPFPEAQMQAAEQLAKNIVTRHNIQPWNVVGHSDVAPERKEDPGELFDWHRLARAGVGLWPEAVTVKPMSGVFRALDVQRQLAAFGYRCPTHGEWDEATRRVILAFQRRFAPQHLGQRWNAQCQTMLEALLALSASITS
jgi:N-acetylmuramoyl-L-alanine amidase